MPIDYKIYGDNWHEISRRIRFERAAEQCECTGECGLHIGKRCEEKDRQPAIHAKGKVMLTVAHLNHTPGDNRDENLKAMCNRCHLRYDINHHKFNRRRNRAAAAGQLWLGDWDKK